MILATVDLPLPDSPRRPTTSPRPMEISMSRSRKVRFWTRNLLAKLFEMPARSTSGSGLATLVHSAPEEARAEGSSCTGIDRQRSFAADRLGERTARGKGAADASGAGRYRLAGDGADVGKTLLARRNAG